MLTQEFIPYAFVKYTMCWWVGYHQRSKCLWIRCSLTVNEQYGLIFLSVCKMSIYIQQARQWNWHKPAIRADGHQRGKGHVGRHCPYTYKIWCGSVHALLRYRSKTTKMQKFPIDSYSNENFISPFFRPPAAANPQKGRRHIRNQNWLESASGLSRNRWQKNEQKNIQ